MSENYDKMHFNTKVIHAGVHPDPTTGAIMTPIYTTSTYVQSSPGQHKGYEYSRTSNPTRVALEEALATLEGGKYCLAMNSGCTGADVLLHLLDAGDHVISVDDVYGGTSRLFRTIWSRHGVETTFVDMTRHSLDEFKRPTTKMIWVETPTNPILKIIDIRKVVAWAEKQSPRPLVVVDNTFATPYNQKPLALGADIVLHSTTKYLNGHSDVIGGAVMFNSDDLKKRLHHIQNSVGGGSSAFDSWLVLRGLKTLAVRMQRHEENAREVATFLERHPAVEKVLYPGLPSHPQHELARTQMSGYGGMITFFLKGDLPQARKVLENVKLFALAESLGGVESLVNHPAIMTHASVPEETRKTLGITNNLVRLSIGLESVEDIKADLDQALRK
jgi:cystathionine gamma-lyase